MRSRIHPPSEKAWKRPINGIILSISVDTLLSKNNKQLEYLAKNFRDRFDELSKAFMSSIPIYLVITKSDKIDGFKEYFSSLNQVLAINKRLQLVAARRMTKLS